MRDSPYPKKPAIDKFFNKVKDKESNSNDINVKCFNVSIDDK